MYKFRIKKVKRPGLRPQYYPQYKRFLFWKNIGYTDFINSIFNTVTDGFFILDGFVCEKYTAEKIIKQYILYLNDLKLIYQIYTSKDIRMEEKK